MMLDKYFNEDATEQAEELIDAVAEDQPTVPGTAESDLKVAGQVEDLMQAAALEALTYFEGGEEAVTTFVESAEVQAMVEARRLAKKTFVRLNKNDDLERRKHLAALLLAKENKDPLWGKWSILRIKERKLRKQIYLKYDGKSGKVARQSQQTHLRNAKKLPALPKISL